MSEITPLPTPVPQRSDPANFAARADELLTALPTFVTETNVVAGEVNTNAANAATSATKSQNYATKDDGFAEGSDNSAKSWAVGGTGAGQPTAGSAKDWATSATSPNGTSDKSAKTYASEAATSETNAATSEQFAEDWANKVGSTVDGSEYSSKEYAVGTAVPDGSAKEWAISATSPDGTSSKSAKSYAEDSAASAAASEASKVISVTKAGEASASAASAASSAATAEAIAASIGFQDVLFISFANSPYNVTQADSGKLISCDTSSGNVVVHLPVISSLTLPFVIGVKKSTADSNTASITLSGSDTFDDGTTSKSVATPAGFTLLPDTDTSPDVWAAIGFGGATAGPVTSSGITMNTAKILGRNSLGNGAIEEIPTVTQPEAEAGIVTELRGFTPQRISQAIVALSPKGISTVGSVITSSTSLTASSEGYQPIQMSSIGQSITLPDATTILIGGPRYILDNTQGGYPVGIRDYSGKLIMAIAAGGEAFVSLKSGATAAGAWSVTGTNLEPGLITIDSTFSSTYSSAVLPPYVALDANTSIHFAVSSAGLVAFIVDNIGKVLTTPVTVASSAPNATCSAFKISATQAILFYANSANTTTAVVLTVSGASPSLSLAVGTAAASAVAGDYSYHAEDFKRAPKIVQLSASLYVYSFSQAATRTSAVAVSVSGTTVTFGAALELYSSNSVLASTTTYALTGSTALVLYKCGTAAPYVNFAVVVSVSGTTCTLGSSVSLTGCASSQGVGRQPSSVLVSPNKCIVADDNNTTNTVNAVALTISGTSVSAGAAVVIETATGIGSGMPAYTQSNADRYTPHVWTLTTGATNTVGLWYQDSSDVSRVVVLSETGGVITKGTIIYDSISANAVGTPAYGIILPQGTGEFLVVKNQQASTAGYWPTVSASKINATTISIGASKPLRSIAPSGGIISARLSGGDYIIGGNSSYGGNSLSVLRTNGDAINYRGDIAIPGINNSNNQRNPGTVASNRMVLIGTTASIGNIASGGGAQLRLLNVEIAA